MICNTIIVVLGLLCIGVCVWCLVLDNRVDQLRGYIGRIEREHKQALGRARHRNHPMMGYDNE